jgi:hypothetical protein
MANNYEPIATTTLSSTSSVITFSSIPATYQDLRLIVTTNHPSTNDSFGIRFNSNTSTTNYSDQYVLAKSTAVSAGKNSSSSIIYAGTINQTPYFGLYTYDIFAYAGSTFKTVLGTWSTNRNGTGTDPYVGTSGSIVGMYRSTSAISTIFVMNTTFNTGTTATLYGIKASA